MTTGAGTYHGRDTPLVYHGNQELIGPGWNARSIPNNVELRKLGIPFSAKYLDPGVPNESNERLAMWEAHETARRTGREMSYAPLRMGNDNDRMMTAWLWAWRMHARHEATRGIRIVSCGSQRVIPDFRGLVPLVGMTEGVASLEPDEEQDFAEVRPG